MSEYLTHILPGGLRIIYQQCRSSVSYAGFTVNVGTRDECAGEEGLAHFVEHLIFKGTARRKSWHILNRMENVGGELNAYTSKEETVVYSVFLSEHLSRAVELMCDLIRNSQFPEVEIEREREVILDEINSYKDTPSEQIYDEFENLLFSQHALGHNILGNRDMLLSFSSADGRRFLQKHYVPSRLVFFYRGAIPFRRVIATVTRYMGDMENGSATELMREAPTGYNPFSRRVQLDTHQAHVLVGNRAYDMFDTRRPALFLLNNLLGGPGMNSRLNVALREKRGYVYTVESSVTNYTDTGVFAVYFGTDPAKVDTCLSVLNRELRRLRQSALSSMQLANAKRQFIGQMAIGSENNESMALGMGKSYMHYNRYDSLEDTFARINGVSAQDILAVANEIFDESALSTLIYI
ncbi:MAG: insulinase family protein [Coprobacter sp.]|nr:insulinase family protein [Coprobacter sp.]